MTVAQSVKRGILSLTGMWQVGISGWPIAQVPRLTFTSLEGIALLERSARHSLRDRNHEVKSIMLSSKLSPRWRRAALHACASEP